jgi:hypothetical protein
MPPPRTELRDVGCVLRVALPVAGLGCFDSGRIRRNGLSVDGRPIKRRCLSRRQKLRPREQEYSRQPDTRQRVSPGQNRRGVVAVASTPEDFANLAPIHDRSLRRTVARQNRLEVILFRQCSQRRPIPPP